MNAKRLATGVLLVCAFTVPGTALAIPAPTITEPEREFFETKIRPVLIEHCYQCHNSSGTTEGGLAVDHRKPLVIGGDGGPVIVAGKPDQSRLIKVMRHEIDGLEMPEGGPKLEEAIVRDFERWIQMGAPDPRQDPPSDTQIQQATSWPEKLKRRKQWWSFRPIHPVQPPIQSQLDSHANPIDIFINERLTEAGLTASPAADSATLVRRLFLNLTGLPPTAEEAIQWTSRIDSASDRKTAVEECIDHLLDSPQFGERWARHWMDWIRYAESHGSEGDPSIENVWQYRDYLIRAFNQDVPYDQLIREHIAGDLMDDPRQNDELGINESIIGTAHWRMVFHGFAPTDALDEKVRFIDDQINVLSKSFMALTVSCARCHDHKFDAISQADYYAWFGILGSCRPGRNVIDLPKTQNRNRKELRDLKTQVRQTLGSHWLSMTDDAAERLYGAEKDSEAQHGTASVMSQLRSKLDAGAPFESTWTTMVDEQLTRAAEEAEFLSGSASRSWNLAQETVSDPWYRYGVGLDGETSPGQYTVATTGTNVLDAIHPGGQYSGAISSKHPGRLTSPDFSLDQNQILWVQVIGDGESSLRYVIQDYPRNGTVYPVTKLQPKWQWQQYDMTYWNGESVHLELATAKDAPLLTADRPRSWFGIRRAVLTDKDTKLPNPSAEGLFPVVRVAQLQPPKNPSDLKTLMSLAIKNAVRDWMAGTADDSQSMLLQECIELGALPNSIAQIPSIDGLMKEYRRLEDEIPIVTRVPGLEETVGTDQQLMLRGNHKNLGTPIPRRFLEAIDSTSYTTRLSGRVELANDLLRDDNPLTRRVIVNRIWHHLFGRGIVSTPDNFGRLGDQPSHPELLDYLAGRFAKDGWSIKQMIRLIVTSNAWQRSCTPIDASDRSDPDNALLARFNVRRQEAESIRDSMLRVSGRLDLGLYGQPVSTESTRRSVYVRVIRNALDPFMRAFDFPEPFSTVGRRDVTNVPAQSLAIMNDPQVARYADDWARQTLKHSASEPDRLAKMFLDAFGRPPSESELRQSKLFLEESRLLVSERNRVRRQLMVRIKDLENSIATALDSARQTLAQTAQSDEKPPGQPLPRPVRHWDFTKGSEESPNHPEIHFKNGAKQSSRGLTVGNGGYAVSEPLDIALTEKTLEAWVMLGTLDQSGGGVMTVQTSNGVIFDSIVFAEQSPREWLAGSNSFTRTTPFGGDKENQAHSQPIHIVITYASDGTITGYRNGDLYGRSYRSSGPQNFPAGDTVVSFGVRHLPAGGNRLLSGTILKASLYDRPLSAVEVAAAASGSTSFVSEDDLVKALTQQQRNRLTEDRATVDTLRKELQSIPESKLDEEAQVWSELARALFSFKEFIYVR